jgi:hypothetical protein
MQGIVQAITDVLLLQRWEQWTQLQQHYRTPQSQHSQGNDSSSSMSHPQVRSINEKNCVFQKFLSLHGPKTIIQSRDPKTTIRGPLRWRGGSSDSSVVLLIAGQPLLLEVGALRADREARRYCNVSAVPEGMHILR